MQGLVYRQALEITGLTDLDFALMAAVSHCPFDKDFICRHALDSLQSGCGEIASPMELAHSRLENLINVGIMSVVDSGYCDTRQRTFEANDIFTLKGDGDKFPDIGSIDFTVAGGLLVTLIVGTIRQSDYHLRVTVVESRHFREGAYSYSLSFTTDEHSADFESSPNAPLGSELVAAGKIPGRWRRKWWAPPREGYYRIHRFRMDDIHRIVTNGVIARFEQYLADHVNSSHK